MKNHWITISPLTIDEVPAPCRDVVKILSRRDGDTVNYIWTEVMVPALDWLAEDLADGDLPEDYDSEFMAEHFGLEPDWFLELVDYVA